jgi:hypothetical protein
MLENCQCFPHWRTANSQRSCESLLEQRLARLDRSVEDGFLDGRMRHFTETWRTLSGYGRQGGWHLATVFLCY